MDQKRTSTVSATASIAAILVLLSCLYVGSYLLLVDRMSGYGTLTYHTVYRVRGRPVEIFYGPMNWIDRQVRPGYWRMYPGTD